MSKNVLLDHQWFYFERNMFEFTDNCSHEHPENVYEIFFCIKLVIEISKVMKVPFICLYLDKKLNLF